MTSTELNANFALPEALHFETAPGGLTRTVIATSLATAEIYLHGAHVTHWQPAGHKPVLFLSSKTFLEADKAIRGGVPVIFPWFGPRAHGLPGPMHGFARTALWTVRSTSVLPGGAVQIAFTLDADETSHVRLTVTVGSELIMALEVTNRSAAAFSFEEALHSYFAIGDIHQAAISGLEGTSYIDKTDNFTRKQQPDAPIAFAKETDQVHSNTAATCVIADAAWNRRITIRKSGSNSTVVWNPWVAKTATMADMAPHEWVDMVCVETANVAENAVTLAAGESHALTARISVE